MKIETFDLLEFENANSHEKQIYAKKIDEHLQKIGFLIVVNHSISKICLNNISLVLDNFFNQNENEILRRDLKLIISHTKDISH